MYRVVHITHIFGSTLVSQPHSTHHLWSAFEFVDLIKGEASLSLTLSVLFYGWWWIASIVNETRCVRLLLRWGIRLNYSIIATQYIAKGKERSHGG